MRNDTSKRFYASMMMVLFVVIPLHHSPLQFFRTKILGGVVNCWCGCWVARQAWKILVILVVWALFPVRSIGKVWTVPRLDVVLGPPQSALVFYLVFVIVHLWFDRRLWWLIFTVHRFLWWGIHVCANLTDQVQNRLLAYWFEWLRIF